MQIDFVDQLIACLPHTRDFHYAMLEGSMLLPANPNDPKDHLRYHVRIDSLRFACESLFAEKQKSYLS